MNSFPTSSSTDSSAGPMQRITLEQAVATCSSPEQLADLMQHIATRTAEGAIGRAASLFYHVLEVTLRAMPKETLLEETAKAAFFLKMLMTDAIFEAASQNVDAMLIFHTALEMMTSGSFIVERSGLDDDEVSDILGRRRNDLLVFILATPIMDVLPKMKVPDEGIGLLEAMGLAELKEPYLELAGAVIKSVRGEKEREHREERRFH